MRGRDHQVTSRVFLRSGEGARRQQRDPAVCRQFVLHRALVDGCGLAVQLDWARQDVIFRHGQPGLHGRGHCVNDLVNERVDFLGGSAGDRHLIGQHHLRDR